MPAAAVARLAGLGLRVPRAHPAPDRPGPLRRRSGRCLHRRRALAARLRPLVRARASSASASRTIADCFAELMTGVLGYARFAAQGGDWGAFITSRLATRTPSKLIGIHLNLLPVRRDPATLAEPDAGGATRTSTSSQLWLKEETGYQWIQGTRPQTLAFGLTDSPAGLAAWIVEKFRAWSDCGGDVESVVHAATSCWPTSASTGSPARSARRSGPTTRACTGRGRSPKADGRRADRLRRVPARDPAPAALAWPSAPTPTSVAGRSCRTGGISPRWSSPRRWRVRLSSSFVPAAALGMCTRGARQPPCAAGVD